VFTGLVSHVGTLTDVRDTDAGRTFTIAAPLEALVEGESIACDGVCLTVREFGAGHFTVAAVTTTLARTHLGDWAVGRRVNLERAMRLSDRLGGHLVQGHVDGVGTLVAERTQGDAWLLDVALWDDAMPLCVPHGSITIDGVSLTIDRLPAPGVVGLSIIEYTRRHTTLGDRRVGDPLHVELDVIGKFVRQLAAPWGAVAGVRE
jgi:riboflavin synthase